MLHPTHAGGRAREGEANLSSWLGCRKQILRNVTALLGGGTSVFSLSMVQVCRARLRKMKYLPKIPRQVSVEAGVPSRPRCLQIFLPVLPVPGFPVLALSALSEPPASKAPRVCFIHVVL